MPSYTVTTDSSVRMRNFVRRKCELAAASYGSYRSLRAVARIAQPVRALEAAMRKTAAAIQISAMTDPPRLSLASQAAPLCAPCRTASAMIGGLALAAGATR